LLAWFGGLSLATYLVTYFLPMLFPEQNLKKKYNASWAVVTGASSGIGRAITEKLADQGINVVMVALDEPLFVKAHGEISAKWPSLQFRRVPVNLGSDSSAAYMEPIVKATADIQPNLIFNNAGYMAAGFIADSPIARVTNNYHCNSTAPIHITHWFLNQFKVTKQRGAIFFTSSPAGAIVQPLFSMYGATKAFLTSWAMSLAAEVHADGIDVLVVHPSPVDTAFYTGNDHVSMVAAFKKTTTSPTNVASCFFRSIGRVSVHDQGYLPFFLRTLNKVLDVNLLAFFMMHLSHLTADYVKLKKARKQA